MGGADVAEEPVPEPAPEIEPKSEPKLEPEIESKPEIESVPEFEPKPESEIEPKPEYETEPVNALPELDTRVSSPPPSPPHSPPIPVGEIQPEVGAEPSESKQALPASGPCCVCVSPGLVG